jgi:hypothetical protein
VALHNIESIRKRIVNLLNKLTPPQGVEVLSYKRNRGIVLLLEDRNTVRCRERGYLEQEFCFGLHELEKPLKIMLKREFPRSRKVRLYQLSGPQELDLERKQL